MAINTKILIVTLILLSSESYALEKEYFNLQLIYSGLHLIDMKQTLDIGNDINHHETNIILGKNPSEDQIYLYFISTLIAQWVFVEKLPKKYRHIYQITWISIEAKMIEHNIRMGFKVKF